MTLKSELLKFLSRIPNAQTVRERRALISITDFDYLNPCIDFEGNNYVFFSDLINRLVSEGQVKLCGFLKNLNNTDLLGIGHWSVKS